MNQLELQQEADRIFLSRNIKIANPSPFRDTFEYELIKLTVAARNVFNNIKCVFLQNC